VLEPIFEASFLPCSFGFRPKRSAHQAIGCIRQEVNAGARWVVDLDFSDFFGSLDRGFLLGLVARRVSDRRVLMIRQWMSARVMEDGVFISSTTGVPQGGTISPLLSNIYGHAIDALWQKEASHLGTIVRYADDGVILCRTEADAQQALGWLRSVEEALKLRLHPEKTRVVDLRQGVDGFDFLGFHLRLVRPEAREVVLPVLALEASHGQYSGQGQSDHGLASPTEGADRGTGDRAQPGSPRLGPLLLWGQLQQEVCRGRPPCPRTPGALRQ
jgi:group II intron reverse transcriptase/maturase